MAQKNKEFEMAHSLNIKFFIINFSKFAKWSSYFMKISNSLPKF